MSRKNAFAVASIMLFSLVACSTPYQMTLKDGTVIQMVNEPEFDKNTGFYEYTTVDGKDSRVNKDEVIEIKEM